MENCLFCKLVKKEIPTNFIYEDDKVVAFHDIHPMKPVHVLVIPRDHIQEFIAVEDPDVYKHLFSVVKKIIGEKELQDKGYKIVMNGGGAQEVNHLHIHIMGPITSTE